MKIEYLPPEDDNRELYKAAIRQAEKEETIGCLVMGLFMLLTLFLFLSMLPFLLIVLGSLIIITALYIAYKMWLESHVLNFIQKHNLRRK